MLKEIRLYRKGFDCSINVNDCFDYQKSIWVILKIKTITPALTWNRQQELSIDVVAQKEGTYKRYPELEMHGFTEGRYRLDKGENPLDIGDIISGKESDALAEITSIENMRYEFTDLIITYGYSIIQEYPLDKLNKLIKKERLKKFKVI